MGRKSGPEGIVYFVKDNGAGFDGARASKLFAPFARLHTATQFEGTGIGLAIVRKGIERMGGSVGVESDGMTGSQFWIELPAAKDR